LLSEWLEQARKKIEVSPIQCTVIDVNLPIAQARELLSDLDSNVIFAGCRRVIDTINVRQFVQILFSTHPDLLGIPPDNVYRFNFDDNIVRVRTKNGKDILIGENENVILF
jgi:hypothetical protein